MVKLLSYMPFFMGTVESRSSVKMNYTRIIEALMIAALTACGTGYVTLQLIEQKSTFLEQRVDAIDKKIDRLVSDLYEPRRK